MTSASLLPLLSTRRIVICVGSGGVGKTTSAATLALLAAVALGRRVLVLTIDPARRLADALGVKALGHDIQRVPDDKLDAVARRRGIARAPGGTLSAMMLDQKRAFDEVGCVPYEARRTVDGRRNAVVWPSVGPRAA